MDFSQDRCFKAATNTGRNGSDLEIRLALLLMIKALVNRFESFKLGCNLSEDCVGKLDDVVLLYKLEDGIQRGVFVQAKNRKTSGISLDLLTVEEDGSMKNGNSRKQKKMNTNFCLKKYFKSYKTIKARLDDAAQFHCMLLTNLGIRKKDKLNNFIQNKDHFPFSWSFGQIYKLEKNITREFKLASKEKSEFQSFLDTFTLAISQPNEVDLEGHIKQELAGVIHFSSNRLDDVYNELKTRLEKWYNITGTKDYITKDEFLQWLTVATGLNPQLIIPWRSPQNQLKWSELTDEAQNYLLDQNVIFQGKSILLRDITTSSDLEEIENKAGNFNIANELKNLDDFQVGEKPIESVSYDEKYYVERTMQYVTLNDRVHMKKSLKKYVKQHSDGSSYPDFSIQDRSVMEALRREIDKNTFVQLWESEDQFLREEHRVVIISDSPGMGKSTILTSFCRKLKNIHPKWWIISVDLNSVEIEKWNLEALDLSALLNLANLNHPFEKLVFQHRLKDKGEIVFMMDGFDEIKEDRQKAVIKLAKLLLGVDFKVDRFFITTRPHLKETLENELCAFALMLTPFSHEDQINFLVKYWEDHDVDCPDLEEIARKLVRKLSDSIRDREKCFAGIPLQCRMLAEAYINPDTKNIDLPEKLDLVLLYEHFIEGKGKVYNEEKRKLTISTIPTKQHTKNIINSYKLKALKSIFSDCNIKWEDEIKTQQVSVDELKKIGLIYRQDDTFIHQTFAEFLAATSLVEIFYKGKHLDFFIEIVCIEKRCFLLRHFINKLSKNPPAWQIRAEDITNFDLIGRGLLVSVAEECDIFVNVLTSSLKPFKLLYLDSAKKFEPGIPADIFNQTSEDRKTVFHLAAANSNAEIMKMLLDSAKEFDIPTGIFYRKDTYGQTVFHDATESENAEITNMLLDLAKETEILAKIVHQTGKKGRTVFLMGAENENEEILKTLLNSAKELRMLNEVFDEKDEEGKTIIHLAAENSNAEIMKMLLDLVKELKIPAKIFKHEDVQGQTVFEIANENSNKEIMKVLCDSAEELGFQAGVFPQTNEHLGTVFHFAAANSNAEIMKMLLDCTKKLEIPENVFELQDKYGNTVLHCAAGNSNEEIVNMLSLLADELQIPSEVLDLKDENGQTVFHCATENNNQEMIEILLDLAKKLQIPTEVFTQKNHDRETVFHLAATNQNLEITKLLINLTGIPTKVYLLKDKYGRTAFHLAAMNNNAEIMKVFLDLAKKIEILPEVFDKTDKNGQTVFILGAENENSEIIKMLIDLAKELRIPAKVFDQNGKYRCNIFHGAAASSNSETIKMLLDLTKETGFPAALLNQEDEYEKTVFHYAAENSNIEIMKMLLELANEFRIPVEVYYQEDEEGNTVFHCAAENRNTEITEMLLDLAKKLEISAQVLVKKNMHLRTVFHLAAKNENAEIMKMLLDLAEEIGILPEVFHLKSKDGLTVFHLGAENSNIKMIKMLLDLAKKIGILAEVFDLKDNGGKTVFHFAAENSNKEIMKVFLILAKELGIPAAVLNQEDEYRKTLFHYAAENSNVEIMKMLVHFAKELQIPTGVFYKKNIYGQTVFHKAAENSNAETMKMLVHLIGNPAEVFGLEDNYGQSVVHFAAKNRNYEMIKMMIDLAKEHIITAELFVLQDKYGQSVFHLTAMNHNAEIMKMLFHLVKDIGILSVFDKQDNEGQTVFLLGAENGNAEIMKVLLDLARELRILDTVFVGKNIILRTVMHLAAINENAEIMEMLLDLSKEIGVLAEVFDIKDKAGLTVFHFAAYNKNSKIMRMLLDAAIELGIPPVVFA